MCVMPQKVIASKKQGFTLLFAILVSVLVLAVGASMISIALKQVILSGAGRESQYAFYAANTGIECALYWDLNGSQIIQGENQIRYVFPPPGEDRLAPENLGSITCAGGNIVNATGFNDPDPKFTGDWVVDADGGGGAVRSTVFKIAINNSVNAETDDILYCATVTVEKERVTTGDTSVVVTTITSRGLNSCNPDADARAVERGLVLQYTS
jgi:hypothetical protein